MPFVIRALYTRNAPIADHHHSSSNTLSSTRRARCSLSTSGLMAATVSVRKQRYVPPSSVQQRLCQAHDCRRLTRQEAVDSRLEQFVERSSEYCKCNQTNVRIWPDSRWPSKEPQGAFGMELRWFLHRPSSRRPFRCLPPTCCDIPRSIPWW